MKPRTETAIATGILLVGGLAVGLIGYDHLSHNDDALRATTIQMSGRDDALEAKYNALGTTVAQMSERDDALGNNYGVLVASYNGLAATVAQNNSDLRATDEAILATITKIMEPTATPTATPTPEATPDIMTEWLNFWPDKAEEAAVMFGGQASDWTKNPDWTGTEKVQSLFYKKDYYPIEWRPINPDNAPYYWPKTQEEAAMYFFPEQNIDPKWLRPNQYGGWELMQDHWIDGYKTDMTATIHPGVVAEGYIVNGDDVAENDRNFVAWGGVNDQTNVGIVIPLVNGQGMTLWPPGTDPNKIGIEGKPYNIPYYTGPNDEQLGPNAINFTPIYDAPDSDGQSRIFNNSGATVTFVDSPRHRQELKKSFPLAGGTNPQTVRRPQDLGERAMAFQKNPFKGNKNIYRA